MSKQDSLSCNVSRCIDSFFIVNLGCSKNQVDAEKIISVLIGGGYKYSLNPDKADLIILNTCAFIEPAREESVDLALSLRAVYPDKKIILSGCLSERYRNKLGSLLPEINAFFGNRDPGKIIEIVKSLEKEDNISLYPVSGNAEHVRNEFLSLPGSVYIKISEGCSNNCTYCSIPLIRGSHRSRKIDDIINEVTSYIKKGFFEIVLIAQDLASYNMKNGFSGLPKLLKRILAIDGDFWLRLLYIHPDNFPEEIIKLCAEDKRILPYFDIPFQHASSKILHAMGRSGNQEEYLQLIDRIRSKLPASVIRSTFMVGFPGEREKEFQELLSFQKKADIDWAGFFSYSREEGTAAYGLRGRENFRVPAKKILVRKQLLETAQTVITQNRLKKFIGKKMQVLVEEEVKNEDMVLARGYFQAPEVDGLIVVKGAASSLPGERLNVEITGCNGIDLEAVVL